MKVLLSQVTANTVGDSTNRTQSFVVSGIFSYHKTGSGTATLSLKNRAGAVIHEFEIETGEGAASQEVAIPAAYYAELSEVAGGLSVSAFLDGDA